MIHPGPSRRRREPRKLRPWSPVATLAGIVSAICASAANAGIVHIQVERRASAEFGAGFTVGREAECFIVTPLHVVQFASPDSITVTDADGRAAKARIVKEIENFDAALLRVTDTAALDCPADWSDGSGASEAINAAPFLIARKVDDAGRITQTRFFVASASREQIEVQPYRDTDELREGDSGSSLYAGDKLVGMITAVDTRSGQALALTQSQIHGLFGPDVLPDALARVLVAPFRYRNAENPYATTAAREFVTESGSMTLLSTPLDGAPFPEETDYVVSGDLLNIAMARDVNPNYKAPTRTSSSESVGRRLLQGLRDRFEEEVNESLDRNQTARYIVTYTLDVQVEVRDLGKNTQIETLDQFSFEYPVETGSGREMESVAIASAVRGALRAALVEHGIMD